VVFCGGDGVRATSSGADSSSSAGGGRVVGFLERGRPALEAFLAAGVACSMVGSGEVSGSEGAGFFERDTARDFRVLVGGGGRIGEKKAHERPDFLTRLWCSCLMGELNIKFVKGYSNDIHWVIVIVPPAERDITVQASCSVVSRLLRGVNKTCGCNLVITISFVVQSTDEQPPAFLDVAPWFLTESCGHQLPKDVSLASSIALLVGRRVDSLKTNLFLS
jgi:hypothetical protein